MNVFGTDQNIQNAFAETSITNSNSKPTANENNEVINQHFIESIASAAENTVPKIETNIEPNPGTMTKNYLNLMNGKTNFSLQILILKNYRKSEKRFV